MKYDFGLRPPGVRWSQMVLGTVRARKKFLETGSVIVSAYDVTDGRRFYVPCSGEHPAGPGVLYRIRVRKRETSRG